MNLKQKLILYLSATVFFILTSITSVVFLVLKTSLIWSIMFTLILCFSLLLLGLFSITSIKSYISLQNKIKSSYERFTDEILEFNQLGTIIYDFYGNIVDCSQFIRKRFGDKLIGTSLTSFFESININFDKKNREYEFQHNGNFYIANIFDLDNYVSIKDISLQKRTLLMYDEELSVIGELEIDNYALYQSILSEDQLYKLNQNVISMLDGLVQKYNLIFRQYNSNGKFLIITNKGSLDKMIQVQFDFFKSLHNILKTQNNNIIVSISAGFAYGSNNYILKTDLAKTALLQAQGRGGDQVIVISPHSQPTYFGSTTEILPSVDRTRIRAFTKVVEQTLSNSAIDKVIVYGHAVADLDALGSAIGVISLAKAYNKKAYICSSTQDETTKKVLKQYWDVIGEYIIKPQQANKISDENTVVFFVDNAHPTRTDNPEAIKNISSKNIFILDHHRMKLSIDFAPKENRIVATTSSSASELVTEMLMFADKKIKLDLITVQMLLNGICLDTLQFQKHATSKTFEAASWLEARGANSTTAANALKINAETYDKVNELLASLEEVKEGFFLAYADIPMPDDIISIAAEEILRIDGRRASFVVARQEKGDKYKLSARGIDTNVQIICENVGGGGGFAAAAAISTDDLETFIKNIKQAIVGVK
ncbi:MULTISPECIES: DHH family phosphoesterase [unclassified Mycoplasma]|uniref:DHH family phosphoesterase n=1 Tax=unclassified Mycoplasma TaxID=2683645 RepID=UPI00216B2F0F|nr:MULTISPECIES: DHH family phosphoesterase [unclassified Mycoplasma]MCS4536719.1 DHH family phosphoesterase [Mycoplasma sp. CSL7475-4]MCT4469745.1 DHH family phosphoesterase [Mycoplasma sp. HS2188]